MSAPSFSVCALSAAHLARMAQIEAAAHPSHPMSLEELSDELARAAARGFGAIVDGQLVAFMIVWLVLDELTVIDVATDPAYQRRGIAWGLLDEAMRWGREQGAALALLEVRQGNLPAKRLYARYGFEQIGLRRGYYRDGEDAIVMQRSC